MPNIKDIQETYEASSRQWNKIMTGPVRPAETVMFDIGVLILETLIVIAENTGRVTHTVSYSPVAPEIEPQGPHD